MGILHILLVVFALVVIIALLYPYIQQLASSLPGNITGLGGNYSIIPVVQPTYSPSNATVAYALSVINIDRGDFGLTSVTVSNESSAQQHANSMLKYNYFSHWDTFGMKPYMRYTLLGGRGAVSENIGYIYQSYGINVTKAVYQIEHNFVYNDESCCDNGHRDNILDPNHQQVSIGIAYNSTTVYFVEDFINNYIEWQQSTPSIDQSDNVTLTGLVTPGYNISSVEIGYDPTPTDLSTGQLDNEPYNSSYSYGPTVAGIGYRSGLHVFYYTTIYNINATSYVIHANAFNITFNMNQLVQQHGAGAYTVQIWLQKGSGTSFEAATYTFFLDSNGHSYTPAA